jgi:Tfp pilus assembly protein PilO
MSSRARLILTAVATFLVCVLLFFFFVKPQREELASVRLEIEGEHSRTTQLQAELTRLQQLQENAPQLQAELATIRKFIPSKPELANFIFQVQEAADSAGLDFVKITPELPKTPPEGAALAEVRATIGANGGYFSLQDFLRRLYRLDRALRVDTMTVAVTGGETGTTRLGMTITARVFYELPGAAPVTAVPVTGAPAPTTSPTP